jgi:hypothetical protein
MHLSVLHAILSQSTIHLRKDSDFLLCNAPGNAQLRTLLAVKQPLSIHRRFLDSGDMFHYMDLDCYLGSTIGLLNPACSVASLPIG